MYILFIIIVIAKSLQRNKEKRDGRDMIILSDSKSIYNSQHISRISHSDLSIYRNIYTLMARRRYFKIKKERGKTIILVWVHVYIVVKGNEMTDQLAKIRMYKKLRRMYKKLKILYIDLTEKYLKKVRIR